MLHASRHRCFYSSLHRRRHAYCCSDSTPAHTLPHLLSALRPQPSMSSVAFGFGAFGDITTVLQLAWGIRRTLCEAKDLSDDIRLLVSDIDAFTRALQQIKPVLGAGDVPAAVANGVAHALAACHGILQCIEQHLGRHKTRILGAKGVDVWRQYLAASAWLMLGGRREVEALRKRLAEQIDVLLLLLNLSQWLAAGAASTFADSAHLLHSVGTAELQKRCDADTRKLQHIVYLMNAVASNVGHARHFRFFDDDGTPREPIIAMPLEVRSCIAVRVTESCSCCDHCLDIHPLCITPAEYKLGQCRDQPLGE